MLEMILFHHNNSIYNKDWSKPGFGRVCSNPCYIYYLKQQFFPGQLAFCKKAVEGLAARRIF